jgi:hypothetical protein
MNTRDLLERWKTDIKNLDALCECCRVAKEMFQDHIEELEEAIETEIMDAKGDALDRD